ncbi:unnamed protein product [Clonostachys byssicola]|uniref:Uncharacterized protein n=1 Tax=Clonostachys byssicola TaxID=160290 RepID=A0A9N9UAQ4_9HYPO|nr:unnamed protein product [Clonostachys byssicola]
MVEDAYSKMDKDGYSKTDEGDSYEDEVYNGYPTIDEADVPLTPDWLEDPLTLDDVNKRLPEDWVDDPEIIADDNDNRNEDDREIIENDPDLFRYPLLNTELKSMFYSLPMPNAGWRYKHEFAQDIRRLYSYIDTHPDFSKRVYEYLRGDGHGTGPARQSIIIRHYIKKRWERLGVWNPVWGIPGRLNPGWREAFCCWKFRWEPLFYYNLDPDHPIRRALRLRQGLVQGQVGPRHPHAALASDASPREAEAFLTSRPFFMLRLEEADELQRMGRSVEEWDLRKVVRERWYERNDWKEEWNDRDAKGCCLPGWTWPHENPDSDAPPWEELNSLEDIDFTPSEVDALEETVGFDPQARAEEMRLQAERLQATRWEAMRREAMRRGGL